MATQQELVDTAVKVADGWRLRGRWADGTALLRGVQPAARELGATAQARAGRAGAADPVLMSYAIRHVAFCRLHAGDRAGARDGLEESLRLREQAGFLPGW